jgi:hypothetical protein
MRTAMECMMEKSLQVEMLSKTHMINCLTNRPSLSCSTMERRKNNLKNKVSRYHQTKRKRAALSLFCHKQTGPIQVNKRLEIHNRLRCKHLKSKRHLLQIFNHLYLIRLMKWRLFLKRMKRISKMRRLVLSLH